MKLRGILAPIAVLLLASVLSASQAFAAWGMDTGTSTSLSVFAAVDSKSDESGFGASLTLRGRQTTDLTYIDFGDFRLAQAAILEPRQLGMYATTVGVVLAHANRDEGTSAPDGTMTGIEVMLVRSQVSSGITVDLKAASLTKNLNPIDWLTDPDILWIGGGISYTF